jgi:NADH-quinone oxidoreductase subunit N
MTIFLVSLIGLPPMAGFVGKLYLFAAVIKQQFYFLAVVGVLNAVVSAFYYFRIIRTMFLDQPAEGQGPVAVTLHNGALLYTLSLATIVLGLYWEPVFGLADRSLKFFVG